MNDQVGIASVSLITASLELIAPSAPAPEPAVPLAAPAASATPSDVASVDAVCACSAFSSSSTTFCSERGVPEPMEGSSASAVVGSMSVLASVNAMPPRRTPCSLLGWEASLRFRSFSELKPFPFLSRFVVCLATLLRRLRAAADRRAKSRNRHRAQTHEGTPRCYPQVTSREIIAIPPLRGKDNPLS